MAIGKSFNLKKQKMTKASIKIFGLTQKPGKNFIYRHHIEPRSSTYVPREESFLISKIYIVERARRIGEKPKHLRQRQIQFFDIAGKGRNSVLYYNFAQEFVPMIRSQESSSPNSLWTWKQAHVVSSRGTAYLWDNILQVNLEIWWVRATLKWELGKKEVWTPNVVLISELRKSRVTYGSEDSGDLSLRDACLGKPRSTNKRSFIPSNVDTRCKGDNGKGMKGGHKEGTQKTKGKESPLCCIDGHPPHSKSTSTSRRMFEKAISSEEIIKPRWRSCARTSREDR